MYLSRGKILKPENKKPDSDMEWECGCRTVKLKNPTKHFGQELIKCKSHRLLKRAEILVNRENPELICPKCSTGLPRHKCLFELGGGCPRHPVEEKIEELIEIKYKSLG